MSDREDEDYLYQATAAEIRGSGHSRSVMSRRLRQKIVLSGLADQPERDSSDSEEGEDDIEGMTGDVNDLALDDKRKKEAVDNGKKENSSDENGVPTPNSTDSNLEENLDVDPGMNCTIKNLYSGKEDKRGRCKYCLASYQLTPMLD